MRVMKRAPLALLPLLAACGKDEPQPIDPVTAPQVMAQRARGIIEEAGQSVGSVDTSDAVISRAFHSLDDASQGLAGHAMRAPMPAPLMGTMGHTPAIMGSMSSDFTLLTRQEQYDETAKDLEVFLRDRLFVPGNIESKTETEVVYLLKPDPTCRKLPSQVEPGAAAPLDAGCARDLPKLEVRIVLTADGDGARFSVRLGPDRLELSAFVVHSDLLAWEMGLASAKKAADFADTALGTKDTTPSDLTRLEGRIKIAAQKVGDRKVTFSFGVLEALALETSDAFFGTAKSDPLFAVTGDAAGKEIGFKLAVGATDVKTGWDPRGTGTPNKDLHVSVGGLYGETSLAGDAKEMLWKGIGIGHTAASVRGANIFELDLNPGDGRKLDLRLRAVNDVPRLEITPRFDLGLAFKLGAVAGDYKEPPPAHLADETYGVVLAPGSPAAIELRAASGSFAGGVKVVSGSLTLSAKRAGAKVVVAEGQCLTGVATPPAGAHPILGGLTAASCP